MKLKKLSAAIIASTVLVMQLPAIDIAAEDETVVVFSTFNTSGVSEGNPLAPAFTPDVDIEVFSILTYHWNSGSGSPAGTISVYDGEELIGTWEAVGSKGMYNAPDANWTCYPDGLVLQAEHTYSFMDSDPDTWSYNSGSDGYGFVEIRTGTGTKVGTTPSESEKGEEKVFGGHTYQRFDTASTWDDAKAYCEAHGGHLATITSQEEQEAVASAISDGNMDVYWLGATAFDRTPEWINGEEFSYDNFAEGQPDNAFDGYHIAMQKTEMDGLPQYSWGDTDAAGEYFGLDKTGFICEWDEAAATEEITVTFDAGEGTVDYADMKATPGSIYGALPIPTREGYSFEGWALGQGLAGDQAFHDAYGMDIVRLSPSETFSHSPSYFKLGYTVYFDITLRGVEFTGIDLNDKSLSEEDYTVEGNSEDGFRVYGQVKITEKYTHSIYCFVDIHCDKLCEDYTVNSFFVSPTDQYLVTSENEVKMTEDHTLHAVWKKNENHVITSEILIDDWEICRCVDDITGEEVSIEEFDGWVYNYGEDRVYYIDSGEGPKSNFNWTIEDGIVMLYDGTSVSESEIVHTITYDGTFLMWDSGNETTYWRKIGEDPVSVELKGDGTEQSPYQLATLDDYKAFAAIVNSGENKSACAVMTADISGVTEMIGTFDHSYEASGDWNGNAYSGVFDGHGHTLNVNIEGSSDYAAPFCNVNGATIRNLRITGSVSGGMHCSGLAGLLWNNSVNLIENCIVEATVTTNRSHCGGIVGHAYTSDTTVRNCLFSGELVGASSVACGIYGWCHNSGTHTVENCLENGTYTDCSGIDPMGHGTGVKVNIINSYKYTDAGSEGNVVGEMTAAELAEALGSEWKVEDQKVIPKIKEAALLLGDPNNDGKIDAKDASLILIEYSKASTGAESGFTEAQKLAGEVNGDGKIDAKDASVVLAYYALVSTATEEVPTLKEFITNKEE